MKPPARILVAVGIALFTATLPARAVLPAVTAATTKTAVAASTAAEVEVKIDNFTFAPQRMVVKAGTKVTWINEDDIPHTVVSSGKLFRSKTLDTSDAFTFTFTIPGDYAYFCSLHPHMTGTIVVEAETGGVIPIEPLVEHDPFRKPVSTFRDHALTRATRP